MMSDNVMIIMRIIINENNSNDNNKDDNNLDNNIKC